MIVVRRVWIYSTCSTGERIVIPFRAPIVECIAIRIGLVMPRGKFFLDMIEQPIALFQTLNGRSDHKARNRACRPR
jgi:hypothetical protein